MFEEDVQFMQSIRAGVNKPYVPVPGQAAENLEPGDVVIITKPRGSAKLAAMRGQEIEFTGQAFLRNLVVTGMAMRKADYDAWNAYRAVYKNLQELEPRWFEYSQAQQDEEQAHALLMAAQAQLHAAENRLDGAINARLVKGNLWRECAHQLLNQAQPEPEKVLVPEPEPIQEPD